MFVTLFEAAKKNNLTHIVMPAAGLGPFAGTDDPNEKKELAKIYFEMLFDVAKLYPKINAIYNPAQYQTEFNEINKNHNLPNVVSTNKDVLFLAVEMAKKDHKCAVHNPSDARVVYGQKRIGCHSEERDIPGGATYVGEENMIACSSGIVSSKQFCPKPFNEPISVKPLLNDALANLMHLKNHSHTNFLSKLIGRTPGGIHELIPLVKDNNIDEASNLLKKRILDNKSSRDPLLKEFYKQLLSLLQQNKQNSPGESLAALVNTAHDNTKRNYSAKLTLEKLFKEAGMSRDDTKKIMKQSIPELRKAFENHHWNNGQNTRRAMRDAIQFQQGPLDADCFNWTMHEFLTDPTSENANKLSIVMNFSVLLNNIPDNEKQLLINFANESFQEKKPPQHLFIPTGVTSESGKKLLHYLVSPTDGNKKDFASEITLMRNIQQISPHM